MPGGAPGRRRHCPSPWRPPPPTPWGLLTADAGAVSFPSQTHTPLPGTGGGGGAVFPTGSARGAAGAAAADVVVALVEEE
jgi:hypothetical protein